MTKKDSPLVTCQVQALGNLEPSSVEVHVSSHHIAIDRKGWHVSLFSIQPGVAAKMVIIQNGDCEYRHGARKEGHSQLGKKRATALAFYLLDKKQDTSFQTHERSGLPDL
ncbi:hypothetical protein P7K49_028254 [Saguinus oedipus]|uniref:Uncharacterized protein n=1 Tax=Saguinus oedipus TaxID=9490 RepID=A0ABQ9UC05_SAGOE|nr:hypothetical protein P7K49_028254 [Saguinus oedipus]